MSSGSSSSDNDDDSSVCFYWSCGSDYTRWVILAVVLVVVCVTFVLVWYWSMRRARRGFPISGTRWMLPQSAAVAYDNAMARNPNRRHRRRNDEEADPVPTYHAELGENDAGYYDVNGQYFAHVPPPYANDDELQPPAKAALAHVEEQENHELDTLDQRRS